MDNTWDDIKKEIKNNPLIGGKIIKGDKEKKINKSNIVKMME